MKLICDLSVRCIRQKKRHEKGLLISVSINVGVYVLLVIRSFRFMKLFGVPYTIFTVCKLYSWHGNVHTVPLLIFFKRFRLFVNIISFGVFAPKPSCLVQADIDLDDFYT